MRALLRNALRQLNKLLSPSGFAIVRVTKLLDSRVTSEPQLRRAFRRMAREPREWLARQTIFPVREQFDVEQGIRTFYDAYLGSPFRDSSNGSGFTNLLSLYLVARAYRPSLIIDSGTWRGASAWALSLAVPHARLLSFDIDLSNLRLRIHGVTYTERDWTTWDFTQEDVKNSLAYVDDHVDQARRLIELHERGIPVALFDDDFSVYNFALHGHGGESLPKVDFVLDDDLRGEKELAWVEYGRNHVWTVDSAYLNRARALIAGAERLPRLLEISGYSQIPYRIVRLKSNRMSP